MGDIVQCILWCAGRTIWVHASVKWGLFMPRMSDKTWKVGKEVERRRWLSGLYGIRRQVGALLAQKCLQTICCGVVTNFSRFTNHHG